MKFEQAMMNYDNNTMSVLEVDFDARHLSFGGDPELEIDETFESLEAMDAAYQRIIVPYIREYELYDTEGTQDAEIIANLATFPAELEARATGEPMPEGVDALDAAVITFTNVLRERLNRALGPEPIELSCAVFSMMDSGITGVSINGALLAGKTREELEAVLKEHPLGGWQGDDFRQMAGLNLEYSPLLSPFDEFGDTDNLVDDAPQRLFYLACARLERNPCLRDNVTVMPGMRVLWAVHDEIGIEWEWRDTAEAFVGKPARAYFEQTCG